MMLIKQKVLTQSMQHISSSKANRSDAGQQTPHILWKTKLHYHIRRFSSHVSNLSQVDPCHNPKFQYLRIHFSITLTSITRSSKWSLTLRFPQQNPLHAFPLPYTCYMPRLSYSSLFHYPNNKAAHLS